MNAKLIKDLVDKFLGWKLPKDFGPDCGISFDRIVNGKDRWELGWWPVGTNLLTADQAKEMFEYVLCDMALGQAADEPTTENGHIPNGWVHRIDMIYFCKCKGFLGIKHSDLGLYWKCSQCDFSEPVEMPSSLKPPAEGVEATFDEWFNEWAGVGIEAHTKIVADLYHQRQRYKDIARAGWKAARAQVGGK